MRRGEDYKNLKTFVSVGFLNYTLDKCHPEFNAKYMIKNVERNQIFTDKMVIHVIDLTQIDLATQEDIDYGLVRWAKFFKAKSWEDLKALAMEDDIMAEATNIVFSYSYDERIEQIRREMAESDRVHRENMRKLLQDENEILQMSNEKMAKDIERLEAMSELLEAKKGELEIKKDELEAEKGELVTKNSELANQHEADLQEIARLKKLLEEKM